MAIQFARIEIVGRSSNGNACCKGSYNARAIVKDNNTNITYNFKHKGDNVYHTVLLPEHADKRFNSVAKFMNEVEHCEKRKDSQLLKDIVLALPDDKELNLQDRINITHLLIEKRAWVKEGLGVQVDIHKPHDGEKNWHAHLLVTTRRFTKDGQSFGLKATDLNPEFKKVGGKSFAMPEEQQIHEELRDIINDYFKMLGLENRVDAISQLGQEHVGPVRMRSVLNKAVLRNEERREANIEQLNSVETLLERVIANKSVFTTNDLRRELKCINNADRRSALLNEALSYNAILHLSDHNGNDTGLFTTHEVRAEEEKILRLASYVVNGKNVVAAKEKDSYQQWYQDEEQRLIDNSSSNLAQEQAKAVKYLLQNDNGVRILQGRAGTGKSHVLGKVCSISESIGVNVIGIAPTHKARTELAKVGYEQNDTVKGMLFKLHNGRFSLPKNSLIVVDEAGMVANSDYQELMRVAATRKCNVILAGDGRQLSSVSRGGMFEVLADKFGSCEIANIQRQNENWGREVAMCLSRGDARGGLSILQQERRIEWGLNSQESMRDLLKDWQNSRIPLVDKIIIAVENKNVDALNVGARQYLKASGYLVGDKHSIAGREFMRGDRILITKTDKVIGATNGDIGTIEYADSNKFVLSLGSGKDARHVEFNPNEYNGFRHGYTTTVFRAQGASIKDVYVFHDGFSGMRNSYVALSRHVEELKLYANEKATGGMDSLVKQMSHKLDKGSSLAYLTQKEVMQKEQEASNPKGLFGSIVDSAKRRVRTFMDKHLPESEYYNYKKPAAKYEPVGKVLDQGYAVEEKVAVGDASNNYKLHNTGSSALKENTHLILDRSYAQAQDNNRKRTHFQQRFNEQKDRWDREYEKLKSEIQFKAEAITRGLLGDPNRKLSNGKELRYGEDGKLAVRISGERSGTWYDFSQGKGGDMFSLVQHTKGSDFKEAAEYLRSSVGMTSSVRPNLQLVYDHESRDNFTDAYKAKKAQEAEDRQKIKYTHDLHARSKEITSKNVAHRYLTIERGITCNLSADIKTAGIYDKGTGKNFPALVAFARDGEGNITGGQKILLDKKTSTKANIDISKRSFGKISGSFVEVGQAKNSDITIIAEGLETALSIKEAQIDGKILSSLGISNIKNYSPSRGEKIIIAADNDGENSLTNRITLEAKKSLEGKGAFVEIVQPKQQGDFNDVLRRDGITSINKIFSSVIEKDVEKEAKRQIEFKKTEEKESFVKDFYKSISEFESRKSSVFLLEKLKPIIREEQVFLKEAYSSLKTPIEEFKHDIREYLETGKIALEKPEILEDVFKLSDKLVADSSEYIEPTISRHLHSSGNIMHLYKFLSEELEYNACYKKPREAAEKRLSSKTVKESFKAIEKEQNIYANIHGKINHYSFNEELVTKAENAYIHKENNELDKLKQISELSLDVGAKSKDNLLEDLRSTTNLKETREKISSDIENYQVKGILNDFDLKKNNAKKPLDLLDILAKEQNYLLTLKPKLEYPEHIDKNIKNAITEAEENLRDKNLYALSKAVSFISVENLHSKREILDDIKTSHSIKESEKALTISYQSKYIRDIQQNLITLEKEGKLNIHNKTFDSPEKYLDFKEKSSNARYFPQEQFQTIKGQIRESQKQNVLAASKNFGDFER